MLLSIITINLIIGGVLGIKSEIKQWIHDTKFNNPSNWDLKRIPCEHDRVIFPSSLELGVALPTGNTILSELVLSRNGELFLPTNGALEITGNSKEDSHCKGTDISFIRKGTKAWFNPANWQTQDSDQQNIRHLSPIPHLDRIPCEHDIVQFKPDSSFRVQLPTVAVSVGSVKFGTHELSNAEWQRWLSSETGYRQFVGPEESRTTSVSIQPPSTCPEKSGCVCNSVKVQRIQKAVCSFQESQSDEMVQCYTPVTPFGFCCPMCGAFLLIKVDRAFTIGDLHGFVDEYLKNEEYSNIRYHAKKIADGQGTIQIVLVEKESYRGSSVKLATLLAEEMPKDMDLGVTKVTAHSAGPIILGSKLAQAAKTFFATLLAVIITLSLVFYVFVVYQKGMPFGNTNYNLFQFARFENTAGDDDVVLAIGEDTTLDESEDFHDSSPSKAFDNPMYGTNSGRVEDPEFKAFSKANKGETTHENPVYSELKRRVQTNEDKEVIENNMDNEMVVAEQGEKEETEIKVEHDDVFDEILFGSSEQ